jgi:predicted acyl esterase
VVIALLLGAVACSSDGKDAEAGGGEDPVGTATAAADFEVQAGIGFVAVQGAEPGATLVLGTSSDAEVERGQVDRYGSLAFRNVEPGERYTVRGEVDGEVAGSDEVTTLALDEHPPQSFYDELPEMPDGYQYLETRDGTELALTVRPPTGKSLDDGPFPTLINMSGYPEADPESTPAMSLIASTLGYATVSVNVRGTGCSGGIGGLFEETWAADGYDVIEAVAAQPWSAKVGLAGISFPGITQIGTAATQPPHLAAAAPMSVLADIYRTPGYPGGIFNNGFTESWLTDRRADSLPAPESGQGYARDRIAEGDEVCLANQQLRLQTLDPIELANANPYRDPELIDPRSPITVAGRIEAPLLVSGAWQDEQVGSDFANLFDVLPDRPDVKVVVANGVHSTPIEPELLTEWLAFMDIYVAERVPDFSTLESIAGVIAPESQGGDDEVPEFPENPYADDETVAEAKARFEGQPRYRFIFDNGGDEDQPGLPGGGFEQSFDAWPPSETEATRWFFGADGALTAAEPTAQDASDRYFPDIDARPMQTLPGQGQSQSWVLLPEYDWRPLVADTAVAYITPELDEDTAMIGTGSVDLWLKSSTDEADVQVALTEVRPDGSEVYVQNGWLRGSHRALDEERSTELNPWPTHLEADAAPFPEGEFVSVRVAIDPVAHVFREGSRIRISVAAPGGDRTRWSFDSAPPPADAQVWIGRSEDHPSSVVLPLTTVVEPTTPPPPCPSLRGQPCRDYEPASNGG